ncbi:MAG: hypothetical protein JW863_07890 [Chitinispirillaceae bacterium]|nr:hypothetical protein [Chitinispirillaceae bacterium]
MRPILFAFSFHMLQFGLTVALKFTDKTNNKVGWAAGPALVFPCIMDRMTNRPHQGPVALQASLPWVPLSEHMQDWTSSDRKNDGGNQVIPNPVKPAGRVKM